MAARVFIDTGDEVEASEEQGVLTSYKRTITVVDCEAAGGAALAAEAVAAMETYSSNEYSAFSRHTTHLHLYLVQRDVTQVSRQANGKTTVKIRLGWIHESKLENQFIFEGSVRMAQYEPMRDIYGTQIFVEHTFADDDEDYPGLTVKQGGTVKTEEPQRILTATGILAVDFPDEVQLYWANTLNATWWVGSEPGTWKCVRCDFKPYDTSAVIPKWLFTFAFQHSYLGYEPQITFMDKRTGQPPNGLVEGVGYKQIERHAFIDFRELFYVGT
jgi:hypothetical protein